MIIDAHQHFWSLQRSDYGWLTPESGVLYRDYLPEDLTPLLASCQVRQTVLVQAAPSVEETEYLLGLARQHPMIAGVVGWVDMEAGTTAIDQLKKWQDDPYLVGIRPMVQEIADSQWLLRPTLEPVVRALIDFKLCFDALVLPIHLPHLRVFLSRYPELRVVIDHGAKPNLAGGSLSAWREQIIAIAQETGAWCKLSGLLTEAGNPPNRARVTLAANEILALFQPQRVMWGSDWPVLNLVSQYSDWYQLSQSLLADLTDEDRALVMGLSARRFYALP